MKRFLNATVILSSLSLLGFALAQTRSGVEITNTATATYTNAAGQVFDNPDPDSPFAQARSNTVRTTVLPIYRFAITPDGTDDPYVAGNGTGAGQTRTGPAGGAAVFTYRLENQGNTDTNVINLSAVDSTTDDFNFGTKTVYLDNPNAGIQGQLDPQDTAVTSVTLPYNGTPVTLFVEAAVPGTAADSQVARLNLEGRSALGGETDLNNWAELTAFTNAALTLSKTAAGTVDPGGAVTYNVSGANTKGTNPYVVSAVANLTNDPAGPRNGILVSDVVPAGLSYVPGSLSVTSNTTNTVATLYSANGGATWSTTQPAGGVNAVGLIIVGPVGERIATAGGAPFTYNLSFDAAVPANAASGTSYSNTATIRYDSNGDSDGADAGEVVDNSATPAVTTVNPAGAFAVGPYTFPNGDADGSTYTVPNEGYTVTRSGDTQTIATVPNGLNTTTGREVSFRHSLANTANFDDTFTLSSTLPAGFPGSVSFYAVDPDGLRGAAVGDGLRGAAITATAPLAVAAGANEDFYAVVTVPADYTTTAPLDFTVTATATTNQTPTTDATTDTLSAVTEAQAVNISNNLGTNGVQTPSEDARDFPAQPNSTVNIPLIVRNGGADTDTFGLTTAVAPTFPAGYVLRIYTDENCDNVVSGADEAVTDSGALEAGTSECFILQVTVPAGANPQTYSVAVTATSRNDAGTPKVSDTITNTVTVGLLQDFTFTPTPQSQATSATVPVVYTHTVTNNSNSAASVNLTITEPGTPNWTYEYSLTGAEGSYGTLAATNTALQANPVAAGGGTQDVYVRVTPATNAAQGYVDAFTLTATPTYGTTVGTDASVTDTTTIDQQYFGVLDLTKTVSVNGAAPTDQPTSAEPGDTLTYTVTATNNGSGALTNVKVVDAVPANTTFVSASATTGGGLSGQRILYSIDGTTWSQTPPGTLATGSSIFVGVSTNGDNKVDGSDTFPGSGTATAPTTPGVLTLTLTVTIN